MISNMYNELKDVKMIMKWKIKIYHTIRTVVNNNNFLKIGELWSANLVNPVTFY